MELSIVLVVIGLIAGGVLVGRDLIAAAAVRAQISQIEKYNQAVNTFKGKYNNYLPGDIKDPDATQFGFLPRGTNPGQGDGNGVIESYSGNGLNSGAPVGEAVMFWVDMSTAHLIAETFNTAHPSDINTPTNNPAPYMPSAVIGQGNYINVWSGVQNQPNAGFAGANNMFGISKISYLSGGAGLSQANGLTVQQAYNMDKKIDDGFPQTGKSAGCVLRPKLFLVKF